MLSNNNSNPAVCINNLLQIARGEVPYDRVKGVRFSQIDAPAEQAFDDVVEDAEWMLGTYEPRAEVESVEITADDVAVGHFTLKATINTEKEADE